MDVVEENIPEWLDFYLENDGPLGRLTISSDMNSSTPAIFYEQFCKLVVEHGHALDTVLPLVTSNTAAALKLEKKGAVNVGMDGDVAVLSQGSLDIREVVARGKVIVRDGAPVVREKWLEKSKRKVYFIGDEHPSMK